MAQRDRKAPKGKPVIVSPDAERRVDGAVAVDTDAERQDVRSLTGRVLLERPPFGLQ